MIEQMKLCDTIAQTIGDDLPGIGAEPEAVYAPTYTLQELATPRIVVFPVESEDDEPFERSNTFAKTCRLVVAVSAVAKNREDQDKIAQAAETIRQKLAALVTDSQWRHSVGAVRIIPEHFRDYSVATFFIETQWTAYSA